MANHKWDRPTSKISSVCIKCGIIRQAVNRRYGRWEYLFSNGYNTLERPNCTPPQLEDK